MIFVKKPPRRAKPEDPVSLKTFYERRNKVLVVRKLGGLGDILMHMMMFEDFKRLMPDSHLVFACPAAFHDVVRGHPHLDEIVDSATVDIKEYPISFDTTNCCLRYELGNFPDKVLKHRTDIWANHCGVLCLKHNMHLKVQPEAKQWGEDTVNSIRGLEKGPVVLFTPISYDLHRSLTQTQINEVVGGLRKRGCVVFSSHTRPIHSFNLLKVPVISPPKLDQWLGLVNAADYVVTVDTSVFHAAGGLKKPLVGVFTYIDGHVRGQYYDFVLVQKHRYDGNWSCGPCFNWQACTKAQKLGPGDLRPCLTELNGAMIMDGVDKMFERWSRKIPENNR
jgi:hypothetical protein